MGKKSEARALKKAQSQEKFEARRAEFLARVALEGQPRMRTQPELNHEPRVALSARVDAMHGNEKSPVSAKDGSRFGSRVTWCISKADRCDAWSWGEPREWTEEEWSETIYPPFREFERLTWGDIDRQASGVGHKMHHGHEISDLLPEAQARWLELNLEQYDSVFRFRLGGQKRRAWGFIVQAHFHFVWWDREHSLYPTEP